MLKSVLTLVLLIIAMLPLTAGESFEGGPFENIMVMDIKIENNTPEIKGIIVQPGRIKNVCRDSRTVPTPGRNLRPLLFLKDSTGNILYKTAFDYPAARTIPPRPEGSADLSPDVLPIEDPEVLLLLPYFKETAFIEIYNPGESLPKRVTEFGKIDIRYETAEKSFYSVPAPSPAEEENFHILIVASGFTAADIAIFSRKASELKSYFLSFEPFQTYAPLTDVHIYENLEDLECYNGCSGIARLMCCNTTKVLAAAAVSGYLFDEIIVIHNTDTYSGGGYRDNYGSYRVNSYNSYAMVYSGIQFKEMAVHEFGHSFGNLCDEYTYGSEGYAYYPCVNCRENCSDWSSVSAACQTGCDARNAYFRPEDSIMLALGIPYFNTVSLYSAYEPHGLERRLQYFTGQENPIYITLKAERIEDRAWLIRKHFADIDISVDNPNAVPVSKYIISKRNEDGGNYQPLREFTESELLNGSFSILDENLDKNTIYTYRVEAVDPQGKVIAVSNAQSV
ncbi:MAG: hypothetical protein GY950_08280 [bacterium]|nr:hypothetical protein [bacterium]